MNGWASPKIPFLLGMMQGHILHVSQKLSHVKPSYKCEVKIVKDQKMTEFLEIDTVLPEETIDTMLSEETIELGLGNKGFFIYPFIIPQAKLYEWLHNESEASQLLLSTSKWSPWSRSGRPFGQGNGQSCCTSIQHTPLFSSHGKAECISSKPCLSVCLQPHCSTTRRGA